MCVVAGGWTRWTEWSLCSESCGGGLTSRRRECSNPAPQNGGKPCAGDTVDYEACNRQPCPIGKSLVLFLVLYVFSHRARVSGGATFTYSVYILFMSCLSVCRHLLFPPEPKMLPHTCFKSGGGVFTANTARSQRHCGYSWIGFFFDIVVFFFWVLGRLDAAMAYCCPPQVINRSLDGLLLRETAFYFHKKSLSV